VRALLDGPVPPAIVAAATAALLALRRARAVRQSRAANALVVLAILLVTIALELAMGRAPTYRHGPVRLWSANIASDENSQQVSDPYTFTHVIHGAAFYGLTRMLPGQASLMTRAIVAIGVESAWETYENTDQVINRYRAETVSLGYYGDSVLNSVCDIVACGLGFLLAWKLPTRVTVAWVTAIEIALALTIRDNLTLNIVMLIYPLKAIKRWQLGV